MATQSEIAANVRENLYDNGITWYSVADITDSIQDGYHDLTTFSGCISRISEVNFTNNTVYYDFSELLSNFLYVIGIFNKNTNRWLVPTTELELDKLRNDWELWEGEPFFFVPHDLKRIAIVPHKSSAVGSMIVHYREHGSILVPTDTPELHTDAVDLLEEYATGDLFEQAQEFKKASQWLGSYFEGANEYSQRCKRLSRSDQIAYLRGGIPLGGGTTE